MDDQLMVDNIPFHQLQNPAVISRIMNGARPERPMNSKTICFIDALWRITEDCWRQQPRERSDIHVTLNQLTQITQYWVAPSPVAAGSQMKDDDMDETSWLPNGGKLNFFWIYAATSYLSF